MNTRNDAYISALQYGTGQYIQPQFNTAVIEAFSYTHVYTVAAIIAEYELENTVEVSIRLPLPDVVADNETFALCARYTEGSLTVRYVLYKPDWFDGILFPAYTGQRTAAFTPMQAQAMQNVAGMQTSGQITDASNLAYSAGQQGLGAQQNAMGLQNTALGYGQAGAGYGAAASQYGAEGAQQAQQAAQQAQQGAQMYGAQGAQFGQQGAGFGSQAAGQAQTALGYGAGAANIGREGMGYGAQGAGIGSRGVSAAEQGFGAGDAYRQQATSADAMGQYMSPYMQNVVAQQQKDAIRQADIARQGNQAQAVRAGAFGGSRAAVMEAESQRGLQDRLANIQATGSQAAYDKAQQAQQFGANLGLQGLQAGYQGLQTGMQGTAQGIQGAQTGISGQQAALQGVGQAGQMYGLGIQGAQAGMQGAGLGLQGVGQEIAAGQLGLQGAETGIRGQQAGMQGTAQGIQGVQAATGAGQYGLQGASLAGQAAGTLGQLGAQEFGQQQAITDAQMRAGTLQRQEEQQGLDQLYQQFMAEQNYPMEQLGQFSNILRGLPLNQQTMSQYQNPSGLSQAAGLGTAAYGLYQMGRKNGGQIRESDGLDTLGIYNAMRKG